MRAFVFLFFSIFGVITQAFESIELKPEQIRSQFEHRFQLKNNNDVKVRGIYLFNRNGEKELHVYLQESHIISFDTEQLLVIGRDLDENGLIETWFFQGPQFSVSYKQKSLQSDLDYATMTEIFSELFDSDGRWTLTVFARYAFQNLTLTGNEEFEFWTNYEKRQIDLIDLDLRLLAHKIKHPVDTTIINFEKTNAMAWQELFHQFVKHKGSDRIKMVAADVGLFIAGGFVIKGIGFIARVTINKVGLQETINTLSKASESHYRRLKMRVSHSTHNMHFHLPTKVDIKNTWGYGILQRLAHVPILERPVLIIEDLVLKSKLSGIIIKNANYFKEGLQEIAANKGYISLSTSIQLAVEMMARGYFSFSDVPLIVDSPMHELKDIAKHVGSDRDLLQNLSYMTVETAAAAGVSRVLELKGVPLYKRFLVCGFVSTIDSIFMAKVVKGEVNTKRIAGDTAWEVIVGNSQVIFDLWQWQKWKDLANNTGTKSIKVTGLLITLAHQAAGYYYYSKWSDYLEGRGPNQPQDDEDLENKIPDLHPVIIPVLSAN